MLLLPFQSLQAAPIPSHHFTFDSDVTTLVDNQLEANPFGRVNAFIRNCIVGLDGVRGTSVSLDGSTSLVLVEDSIEIQENADFAISLWVNPSTLTPAEAATSGILMGSNDTDHFIRLQTGSVRLNFDDRPISISPQTIFRTEEWQHIGLSRSNRELSLFLNGTKFSTLTYPHAFQIDYIGARDVNGPFEELFHGRLDDVRIFNHALTDADMRTLSMLTDDVLVFSAMANTPFTQSDRTALSNYVKAENLSSPASEFIAHLGSAVAPQTANRAAAAYNGVANLLKSVISAPRNLIPTIAVPGNNDWSMQEDPDLALTRWKGAFLNLQNQFLGNGFGSAFPATVHNHPVHEENFAFEHKNVLFLGLNLPTTVPGAVRDWPARVQDQAEWLASLMPPPPPVYQHHWPLDGGSASLPDLIGNISLGHQNAGLGAAPPNGHPGTGIRLTGNGQLNLASPLQLSDTDDATFALWIKPDEFPGTLFGSSQSTDSLRLQAPNLVQAQLGNVNRNIPLSQSMALGVWQHLAITYNQGHLSIHLNGNLVGTADFAFRDFSFNRIGNGTGGRLSATLDDIRVSAHALTRNEIAALARRAAHYPFDEFANSPVLRDSYKFEDLSSTGVLAGQSGRKGRALRVGSSSRLTLSTPIQFNASENFLISAYLQPTTLANSFITGTANREDSIQLTASSLEITSGGQETSIPFFTSFQTEQWQHLAISRKENTIRVYRNGNLVGTAPDASDAIRFTQIAKNGNTPYRGKIDEFRVQPIPLEDLNNLQRQVYLGDTQFRAGVLFANAGLDGPAERQRLFPFQSVLRRSADGFRLRDNTHNPILYLQGDASRWSDATQYLGQKNIRRVTLNNLNAAHPPTQVIVTQHQSLQNAFILHRRGTPTTSGTMLAQNDWQSAHLPSDNFRDWYLQALGNFDLAQQTPDQDVDNDSATVFEEYIFNTDPTLRDPPGTLLRLDHPGNGNPEVSIPIGQPGIKYTLESSRTLESWNFVSDTPTPSGDRWVFQVQDDPKRFYYRLRADLP